MPRRSTFTVDAESVQGNAGATVTFRRLTMGKRDQYINEPGYGDAEFLSEHIVDWSGIVDDDGHELPSPRDEPGLVTELYIEEARELVRLLFEGPDRNLPKN